MKSESALSSPVGSTIRSALGSLTKKTHASVIKKVSLLSVESSGEDESCGENKKLLLRDVSQSDETQVRLYYQEDTDSDVSDGIFTEQDEMFGLKNCHHQNMSMGSCAEEDTSKNGTDNKADSEKTDSVSSQPVILYQSVEDGSIALKADEDGYEDNGCSKDFYSDAEITSGVSFKMRYLGSTPLAPVKHQVDDVRGVQAEKAIHTICGGSGNSKNIPSNPVIFTVSATKLLVYDGNMQQLLMEHPIKLVSYVGDVGVYLVVMVRYQNAEQRQVFRVTCHVFQSKVSQQVRVAMNKAFTLSYNDVIKRSGGSEETLLQCAYSEVLGSQKRADDISDLLDPSKHVTVTIIKRPMEALGVSLIPTGPGSIIPTIIVSSIKPASPAYKTELLNVGDQILEINKRSLCGLSYEETLVFIKSLLATTKIELQVVPGSPVLVVELIRPDLKYPLGFSVKDGHITTLIRGSIGERAGVRIGHRIIAINEESTVTSDHDTIAGILLSETGRLVLKTMPSQIFNLMLGAEEPNYL